MGLAVLVECREHDWQDDGCVVADEGHDVLIVPVVQRPLSNLCILGFYLCYCLILFVFLHCPI